MSNITILYLEASSGPVDQWSTTHWVRWEMVTRLGLVSLTCLLAAGVPYLDLFISLLGALVMATLELVFPVIVYTAVNWSSITWPTLIKVK